MSFILEKHEWLNMAFADVKSDSLWWESQQQVPDHIYN